MLTIFSCPKPFHDPHIRLIQRNALISWTQLRPRPEIILVGNDEGIAEACEEFGLIHIPQVERSRFGTPLLSDIFRQAEARATNLTLAYVNADIILLDDFLAAIARIRRPQFLMIGYRTDTDISEPLNISNPAWRQDLLCQVQSTGRRHEHTGIDYFVFKPGLFNDMPPFALGRTTFDNWLVWRARHLDYPVIDSSAVVNCIHQNHGYSFALIGQAQQAEVDHYGLGEEAELNRRLVNGWRQVYTLRDANFLLTRFGLVYAWRPDHIKRRVRLAMPDSAIEALKKALRWLRLFNEPQSVGQVK